MKKVTLIRHGQSKEQSAETTDGKNPELSKLGIFQAKQLGQRLQNMHFDLALISPLERAYRTFEIAKPQVDHAAFDTHLLETDWKHHWYENLIGYSPNNAIDFHDNNCWLTPIEARAIEFTNKIAELKYNSIVLFAHQGIFKHLIAKWLQIPVHNALNNIIIDNTSLSGFQICEERGPIVKYINDIHHLK